MKKRMLKELKNYCIVFCLGLAAYILYITGHGIPCPVHMLTGFYCPGCGITRMFYHIIRLDFYTAFRQNECVFILLPLIAVYIVYQSIIYIKYGTRRNSKIINCAAAFIIIVLVIFGVLRNIP